MEEQQHDMGGWMQKKGGVVVVRRSWKRRRWSGISWSRCPDIAMRLAIDSTMGFLSEFSLAALYELATR